MHVDRIPNRNSPPAYLLRETYREGKKVKKRTLANISHWPIPKIEALRRVLRGDFSSGDAQRQELKLLRSLPHGHVAAALGTLRKLKLDRVLSQGGRQPAREVSLSIIQAGNGAPARCGNGELFARRSARLHDGGRAGTLRCPRLAGGRAGAHRERPCPSSLEERHAGALRRHVHLL